MYFAKMLIYSNQVIYEEFYRWCKHHNKEISYAAYAAMEAFFQQVWY